MEYLPGVRRVSRPWGRWRCNTASHDPRVDTCPVTSRRARDGWVEAYPDQRGFVPWREVPRTARKGLGSGQQEVHGFTPPPRPKLTPPHTVSNTAPLRHHEAYVTPERVRDYQYVTLLSLVPY